MPVIDKNTSYLAGEFLVAGELARRGYPVYITMGRAKSGDISTDTQDGNIKVEAKALRNKSDWPITKASIKKDKFYIFVFLLTKRGIDKNQPPEYFVAKAEELLPIIETFGKMQGVKYSSLKRNKDDFENRWDKLPKPP